MPLRFMTPEKIAEYPALARAAKFCQTYSLTTPKGGCEGCRYMVEGCEKIIKNPYNREVVFEMVKNHQTEIVEHGNP